MRGLLVIAAGVLGVVMLTAPPAARAEVPDEELPDGEGKKILMAACTSCHALSEVTKFKGYYNRAQWRDIVVTMQEYGAPIEAPQVDVLADYLALHLGKR